MQMIIFKTAATHLSIERDSRIEGGELGVGRWKQNNMSEVSQLIDQWRTQTLQLCTNAFME